MQKRSDPSFFLTKTTVLHQGLLLSQTTPASNINFKCSLTSSTWGWDPVEPLLEWWSVRVLEDNLVFSGLGVTHVMLLQREDIMVLP